MQPRRHPLLPTSEEARDKSTLYSDHLLIMGVAEFDINKAPITILALNVLSPGTSTSGFHTSGQWESREQTIWRYQRMINGLVKAIKKHGASLIFLQEAPIDFLGPLLKKALPSNWLGISDPAGLICCYDGDRFMVADPANDLRMDNKQRICSMRLTDKKDKKVVCAHNVWGIYNPFPQEVEESYRKLLAEDDYALIMGDTNSRIAPVDNTPRNITTNLIPLLFNTRQHLPVTLQRPDFPDGGFFKGPDRVMHQLPTRVLHYETGDIVVDERGANELQVRNEFQMILCLDAYYQQNAILDGKTIFEYQQFLKNTFNESTMVRMASDSFNRKAIGIRFMPSSNMYKYLVAELGKLPDIQQRHIEEGNDSGRIYPVIFIPVEKIELLIKAIRTYQPVPDVKFFNLPDNRQGEGQQAADNLIPKKPSTD